MDLFSTFLISVFVTVLIIPSLRSVAGRLQLMDHPAPRKIHSVAIPRCGGIGIAVGFLVPVCLWLPMKQETIGLLLGGGGIVLLGVLDDAYDLNYKWKLLGQFVFAGLAINCGVVIEQAHLFGFDPLPNYLAYFITAVFLVGVTNAVNMSDGLDGLAAGVMLLTFAMIGLLAYMVDGKEVLLLSLAMMGAILGFLRYNTHPAIIFLGDAGSQFLGFMAASIAILLTQSVHSPFSAALPLLLLGLPILDLFSVMIQRRHSGNSLFSADNRHLHHKLLARGFSHSIAVAVIYLIQAIFLAAAYVLRYENELVALGIFFIVSVIPLTFFYRAGKVNRQVSIADCEDGVSERRNRWLRKFAWLPEIAVAAVVFALIAFMMITAWIPKEITIEYSWFTFTMLVAVAVASFCPTIWYKSASKLAIYIAIICLVQVSIIFPPAAWVHQWVIDLYLVGMTLLLLLAIRVTRRSEFRLTTQDLLMVLLVAGVVILFGGSAQDVQIDEFVTRVAVLCYSIEFLLLRTPAIARWVNASALVSLAVIGVRGIM